MAKEAPTVKIPVELYFDHASGDWVITTLQAPKIAERGMDVKQARIRLHNRLDPLFEGKVVELEEKLKLPKELAAEVEAYDRIISQIEKLQEEVSKKRIPLAKKLIREGRLQQAQAADLLRISGTWLGQQLRQTSTEATLSAPEVTKTKPAKSK